MQCRGWDARRWSVELEGFVARADMLTIEQGSPIALGGAADAYFELGLKYSTGRDTAADLVTAHKWFNLAALKGNQAAKSYRAEIAAELSKSEIALAQKLAREHLQGKG